jgi:hypothetical protein
MASLQKVLDVSSEQQGVDPIVPSITFDEVSTKAPNDRAKGPKAEVYPCRYKGRVQVEVVKGRAEEDIIEMTPVHRHQHHRVLPHGADETLYAVRFHIRKESPEHESGDGCHQTVHDSPRIGGHAIEFVKGLLPNLLKVLPASLGDNSELPLKILPVKDLCRLGLYRLEGGSTDNLVVPVEVEFQNAGESLSRTAIALW